MNLVETILLVLVELSLAYWLLAWWSVEQFFRAPRLQPNGYRPPVSILKPIKGLDPETYENFLSVCRQDYPQFEILFGVADSDDPAVGVVRRLQRENPQLAMRLIVAPQRAMNPKSSTLDQLALDARHEILVVSDSDIRVTPDYLGRVVGPLEDPRVGLVTCLYRNQMPRSLPARLEAIYLETDFLPSVIVANRLFGVRFGLGATMVMRRDDLIRMGGYASIADYLTDDYQVTSRIARLGRQVRLSDCVVTHVLGEIDFREQWDREIRWARGIRASCPRQYPGLLLTFSTPWAAVLALVSGFSTWAMGLLGVALLVRWLVAWRAMSRLGQTASRRSVIWLPLRDLLTAVVWAAGLVGRRIRWRGRVFSLLDDGRLETVRVY
jgi:ceramide glucosyltransferase